MKIRYVVSGCVLVFITVCAYISSGSLYGSTVVDGKIGPNYDVDSDEYYGYTNDGFCFEYDEPVVNYAVDPYALGRLSSGIISLKDTRDNGVWYYCGKRLSVKEIEDTAVRIAYHVLVNMDSYGLSGDVSPYGIAATAYNESGLDPCALGLYPRKWAYNEGLLTPSRMTVSHSRDEISEFKDNRIVKDKYRRTGIDLGICQILSRFYRGRTDEMLTLGDGIKICISEMRDRAVHNKTDMPWLYWPGHESQKYRRKIRRYVKMMNPPYGELDKI